VRLLHSYRRFHAEKTFNKIKEYEEEQVEQRAIKNEARLAKKLIRQ
jgi:hypothetical protein